MRDYLRDWNKKNQKNYVEIYIKTDLKKIIKEKKKKIYHNNTSQIVGISNISEIPKNPHIILNNSFKKSINQLSEVLLKRINNLINQ